MPTSPDRILGYMLVGIAAFLFGGAVTVLCILLRKRKDREGAGRDRDH